MPRKRGRLPADHSGKPYLYRSAVLRADGADGFDDSTRSFELVLATENPVEVFDKKTGRVIQEVLRLDGLELPQKVALVDSHDRQSVRSVLGSIRDLRIEGNELIGRAYFAADEVGRATYEKYRDGHLTDFSVGAAVVDAFISERGVRNVSRSVLREGSAVFEGQDPGAKVRNSMLRAYVDPHAMKAEAMTKALIDTLIERGLSEDATEGEAVDFLVSLTRSESGEPSTVEGSESEEAEEETETDTETEEETEEVTEAAETGGEQTEVSTVPDTAVTTDESAEVSAAKAERKRIAEIDEICRNQNTPEDVRRAYIDNGASVEKVARAELKRQHEANTGGGGSLNRGGDIRFGESEREKFYAAAEAGMLIRLADQGSISLERSAHAERASIRRGEEVSRQIERAPSGASDFAYVGLPDLARVFLERSGERVFGLPKQEIVRRAIAQRSFVERAGAHNTTGSFANLMLDAANKVLLSGYDEAEYTYSRWVRQAPSAPDFKALNRIRFGELADPEVVPENNPYPEKETSDAKESYGVEKYGEVFSISLEAIVNDDLNAITRIPQMQGAAMRRKINKVVYSILTANDPLSDGIDLFHATSHGANLDSNALAESALDTGWNVMSQQTGLSGSGTVLGIRPKFLIVPTALAATAWRLVGGNVVPTSSGTNVPLYGEGRPRSIEVVEEAQLDGSSTTAWWLAAAHSVVDTIEITFLQGEESPVLSREEEFLTDAVKYKIRQTFAAAPIDFRGLYQGNS